MNKKLEKMLDEYRDVKDFLKTKFDPDEQRFIECLMNMSYELGNDDAVKRIREQLQDRNWLEKIFGP